MKYLKLLKILRKNPQAFRGVLSKRNLTVFFKALVHEDHNNILRNIQKYLDHSSGVHLSIPPAENVSRLSDFISHLKSSNNETQRRYVLFVSHEATLTGAPLIVHQLAKDLKSFKNIQPIFLLIKSGEIRDLFTQEFPTILLSPKLSQEQKEEKINEFISNLITEINIEWAIVNSAESRFVLPILHKIQIPKIVSLVHEMGNFYPAKSWSVISKYSNHIIFPCNYILDRAEENTWFDKNICTIRGQGLLKPEILEADREINYNLIRKELDIPMDSKIVLSCGSPIARKGIDIFVFTAISTLSGWKHQQPVFFIWIGDAPQNYYQQWTQQDILASKYSNNIRFIGSKENTIPWFVGSDLFFLTSRGDPFPCVVHEALAAGLQVVGFDNTGGLPEMLPPEASYIQAYGDIASASVAITEILHNQSTECRSEIMQFAKDNLKFKDYSIGIYDKIHNLKETADSRNRKLLNPQYKFMDLPVPPKTHMEYGESKEVHLKVGKIEVDNINKCLEKSGYQSEDFINILEFGCNNGRLLRWFYDPVLIRQLHGCDINEKMTDWLNQNLGEIIRVLVNSHAPPLPYEDDYFDFVFAGSVFTHIDEHAQSWLLELSRIVQPGGVLYITYLDEKSMQILSEEPHRLIYNRISHLENIQDIWDGKFEKVSIAGSNGHTRNGEGLVLNHSHHIQQTCPKELEIIQIMPKAFAGFQTAYLYRKKQGDQVPIKSIENDL